MSPQLTLRFATADELPQLEPHWQQLYVQQQAEGMQIALPPNAFALWSKGLAPMLGRFAQLVLAETNGELLGFVAARCKSLPPWFGGGQAGFISEVYVLPAARGMGLTRKLLDHTLEWFKSQQINRVELQVISGNPHAREVYAHLGWTTELSQMVISLRG